MYLEVPEEGFHNEILAEFDVRNAQFSDVEEMVALEKRLVASNGQKTLNIL